MNFELEYLWNLCTEQSAKNQSVKQKHNLQKEFTAESDRLKRIYLFFVPQRDLSLAAFIQFHQHSLSRLLAAMETSGESSHASQEKPSADPGLCGVLDELLEFLKYNFPREFDFSARLCNTSLQREQGSQQVAELIDNKLEEKHISPELCAILTSALSLSDREHFSYEDIGYIQFLSGLIHKDLERLDSDQSLVDLLTRHNFNKLQFLEFLIDRMSTELESALEISEKYKFLLIVKKETEQTVFEKDIQYSRLVPPLSRLILEHLESERLFLKEIDLLSTEWVNSGLLEANYKVSLTVKQLAFYIYLNVECGIITEQRAKKIHQYAIAHLESHEKSGISEKSFKNAYYLHHAEDIKKVMEKVSKMLAIARERY
ncbi:hypothetical protein [Pedobacter sp. Leaf194]|uniref:hypothetical protein n=1 Tax=Pedobacter sp. Leaf194 TaxID=1736297 RepID=UPI000702491B|nr:hypothetical protein [Pedobacter sp. Leaf194]KQS36848.1 hypothetical protein ASG14_07370 [Pedobacter sp. Leaf194]